MSINSTRRQVLAGMLTTFLASKIPFALAQPIKDEKDGAFLAVSSFLVGEKALNRDLAKSLHKELSKQNKGFDEKVKSLLDFIETNKISVENVHAKIDNSNENFADIPQKILYAWTFGIVGDGEDAVCLAYENAYNNIFVSDVLQPPTYAFGEQGSWTSKPHPEKEVIKNG